jgi:hypothetical protein
MTTYRLVLPLALLAIALAGCTTYRDSRTPIPGYGNAVIQNSAVMIADPQPASAANTTINFDGRAADLAIERYRQGKVIPPLELKTTEAF